MATPCTAWRVASEKAGEPLSYYHAAGPAGDTHGQVLNDRTDQHVGVIGLGTGSLAAYAGPQRHITFTISIHKSRISRGSISHS